MGKFKEFVPVVGALIIVALCALIPLGVGLGDDGLSGVRSATAALATTNIEGQSLQAAAQQDQQAANDTLPESDGEAPKRAIGGRRRAK